MKLSQLIDIKINLEKIYDNEILLFICYFQNRLYDGYSENSSEFITQEDFEAIEALANKISHMVFNIGCPNSVIPMLESICTRKIKRWQGNNAIETDNHYEWCNIKQDRKKVINGFKKGKQLKTNQEIARVKKAVGYYNDKGLILVGHFRWNNRGYILSRKCTDILTEYIQNNF